MFLKYLIYAEIVFYLNLPILHFIVKFTDLYGSNVLMKYRVKE